MKKTTFIFSLLSGSVFLFPDIGSASGIPNYIHTNTPELKPISQNYVKLASVCFLGVGDCAANVAYGKDGNYTIDTAQQCLNEGFVSLNCNSAQVIDGVCPYNAAYGKACKCRTNLVTCPAGQVGFGDSCGGKYVSCQCSPSLVSCASNQVGQGASCGGKYQSCVCKPEYQYTSANCAAVTGESCGGKYLGCSPCAGYYDCGGTYQYCEGRTCASDSSKCSTQCASDYFPYKCASSSICSSVGGIYRNGYCSKSCPTAPVDNTNFGFWCCNSSCDYAACIAKAGYNCQSNSHWSRCLNSGGTPEFVKCVGPDYGAFDNNYGYENVGVAPYNAAQYYCRH